MTRRYATTTDFTAGELDPKLVGRIDLSSYQRGAKKLQNVIVQQTGGLKRRPGSIHVADTPNAQRLLILERPDNDVVIVLADSEATVFENDIQVQTISNCPWNAGQISHVSWIQFQSEILLCNAGFPPQRLFERPDGIWICEKWSFSSIVDDGNQTITAMPFSRFANSDVAVQIDAPGIPSGDSIPAGTACTVTASSPAFLGMEQGTLIRIKGRQVAINSYQPDGATATGFTLQELPNGEPTTDWEEQAFSQSRGWPSALTLHQRRLVIAGSGLTGDSLWFSKTGDIFNFDFGSALDDEAIAIRLVSEYSPTIRYILSGRHLQIFTDRSEWIMTGQPITPTHFNLSVQTNIGSYSTRTVRPINIDGATLFIGRQGNDLREFLFTEIEQAYQAPNLAVMASHLLNQPKAMAFDPENRIFLIVNENGTIAAVSIDRNTNIIAWSKYVTQGFFTEIVAVNNKIYFLVENQSGTYLGRFSQNCFTDLAYKQNNVQKNQTIWNLERFNDLDVFVSDDIDATNINIASGNYTPPEDSTSIEIGLSIEIEVEPLPFVESSGIGSSNDIRYRIISTNFLLHETPYIGISNDTELAQFSELEIEKLSGIVKRRAIGWKNTDQSSPWLIKQRYPTSFNLLSATIEAKVGK